MSQQNTVSLSNVRIDAANNALAKLAQALKVASDELKKQSNGDKEQAKTIVTLRWRIVQNSEIIAPLATAYANSREQIIMSNNPAVGEDGKLLTGENNAVKFKTTEDLIRANEEAMTLNAIENTVVYYPLTLSMLATALGVDLDFDILVPLKWMIIDDVEE